MHRTQLEGLRQQLRAFFDNRPPALELAVVGGVVRRGKNSVSSAPTRPGTSAALDHSHN